MHIPYTERGKHVLKIFCLHVDFCAVFGKKAIYHIDKNFLLYISFNYKNIWLSLDSSPVSYSIHPLALINVNAIKYPLM